MLRKSLWCLGLSLVLAISAAELLRDAEESQALSLLQMNMAKRATPTAASTAPSGLSSVDEAQRPLERSFVLAAAALGGSSPPALAASIFEAARRLLSFSGGSNITGKDVPPAAAVDPHHNEAIVLLAYRAEDPQDAPAPAPFRPPFAERGGDAFLTFWHDLGWKQELFFLPFLMLVLWYSQSNIFIAIVVIQIFTHMVLLTTTFQCNPAAWCNYSALFFGIAYMSLSTASLMSSEPEKYFGGIWISVIVFLMGIYIVGSHSIAIAYWREYPRAFP